jgi:hypothetical protein
LSIARIVPVRVLASFSSVTNFSYQPATDALTSDMTEPFGSNRAVRILS